MENYNNQMDIFYPMIFVTRPNDNAAVMDSDLSFGNLHEFLNHQVYFMSGLPDQREQRYRSLLELVIPLNNQKGLKNTTKLCEFIIGTILQFVYFEIQKLYENDLLFGCPENAEEYLKRFPDCSLPFDISISLYHKFINMNTNTEIYVRNRTWKLSKHLKEMNGNTVKIKWI